MHRDALRITGLAAAFALAVALMVAMVVVWSPEASAQPKPGPVPQDRTAEVQILGLNETHGQLLPLSQRNADGSTSNVGGAAALATYLGREEAENPLRTLTVDSGDFMQGPAISSYFEGASTVEVYNEVGVDSVAVGNHEFDWGRDALRARIAEASFPFLANNIVEDATGDRPRGIAPYRIFKRDGLKIGVLGVGNPDTKNVTLPEATEGLSFLDLGRTADEVADSVRELKAQKVETIVLTPHMGLETPTEGPLAELLRALPPRPRASWTSPSAGTSRSTSARR